MATVHTVPVDDLIEHEDEGDGCPCGVTVEPVKDEKTGAVGWLIVHHSLDGRERSEGALLEEQTAIPGEPLPPVPDWAYPSDARLLDEEGD